MDENERVERSQKLIELLKKMADPKLNIDTAKASLAAELREIYSHTGLGGYRHRYSEISQILYNQGIKEEQCSLICDNLEELLKTLQKTEEDLYVAGSVDKLIDHITLESMRIGQMYQVLQDSKNLKNLVEQSTTIVQEEQSYVQKAQEICEKQETIAKRQGESYKRIQDMVKEVNKAKEFVSSHHIQSITILSIFTGIVITFSGGLSLLGGVFSSISNISGGQALLFLSCIILVGTVLIDSIVVLLSFLGKYTGSSISKFWSWSVSIINGLAIGTSVCLLWKYLKYYMTK